MSRFATLLLLFSLGAGASAIYASGNWVETGHLATGREDHTATLLPSAQVLVAGGRDNREDLSSAELYDPATGSWTATGSLANRRSGHSASDRILIIPDSSLHMLPFGAMIRTTADQETAGEDRQYVAEWKPLHAALSATVYAELRKRRRPAVEPVAEPAPIALAAFGDPVYPSKLAADGLERIADLRVRSVGPASP